MTQQINVEKNSLKKTVANSTVTLKTRKSGLCQHVISNKFSFSIPTIAKIA